MCAISKQRELQLAIERLVETFDGLAAGRGQFAVNWKYPEVSGIGDHSSGMIKSESYCNMIQLEIILEIISEIISGIILNVHFDRSDKSNRNHSRMMSKDKL